MTPEGISAGPDGSLWTAGADQSGTPVLARVSPGAPSFGTEVLPGAVTVSVPLWDAAGRGFVAVVQSDFTLRLDSIDATGVLTPGPSAPATCDVSVSVLITATGPVVECAGGYLTPSGGRLASTRYLWLWSSGNAVLALDSEGQPVFSLDHGATYTPSPVEYSPIAGAPGLLSAGVSAQAVVLDETLRDSGVNFPAEDLPPVVAADSGGWLAFSGEYKLSGGQLRFAPGSPAGLPGATVGLAAASRAMIARVNRYRTRAGLSSLLSDGRIAQAARNHSRYWTLHPLASIGDTLSLHNEASGTRGYTGFDPQSRCEATQAVCNAEVMAPGVRSGAAAIDVLMNTIYHRLLILDPTATRAGGDIDRSGPAVMDITSAVQIAWRGVGYPVGAYPGPLAFFGGEVPDPVAACRKARHPVHTPAGAPVTFTGQTYATVTSMRLSAGGRPVPACQLHVGRQSDALLPESPLKSATRYTVFASYRDASGRKLATSWTFTTRDGHPKASLHRHN